MKFLRFALMDTGKAAEVAKVADSVAANLPPGISILSSYICQGIPFSGAPPNTLTVIQIIEAESNEAIAATTYPIALAGATLWDVPVLEMPVAGAGQVEKTYRG